MNIHGFREWMRDRSSAVGVVAGVVLLLAIGYSAWTSGRSVVADAEKPKAYFVDDHTGELAVRNADELPPIVEASSGKTLVKAFFFTCSTPDAKWLAYCSKFDPAGIEQIRADLRNPPAGLPPGELPPSVQKNLLVRAAAKGSPWLAASSPQGVALMTRFRCPHATQHPFTPCLPEVPSN